MGFEAHVDITMEFDDKATAKRMYLILNAAVDEINDDVSFEKPADATIVGEWHGWNFDLQDIEVFWTKLVQSEEYAELGELESVARVEFEYHNYDYHGDGQYDYIYKGKIASRRAAEKKLETLSAALNDFSNDEIRAIADDLRKLLSDFDALIQRVIDYKRPTE